ncbi:MAG: transposase [Bryobacterales bacterium]|nr:transposase [Bryobacterales bacterium]
MTICSLNRKCVFGEIVEGHMGRNSTGDVTAFCWYEISNHFKNVELDAFVTMPNHIHGIPMLTDAVGAGHARPLPTIVGSFKSAVSRRVGSAVWQRSYWERVIRNQNELNFIRHYIDDNPIRWPADQENPQFTRTGAPREASPFDRHADF